MKPSDIKAMRVSTDPNQVRVIVGGRASYAHFLEAVANDEDNPDAGRSFQTGILIPKDAPKEVHTILQQAVKDAVELGKKKKWGGSQPAELKLPLRNGDLKFQEDKEKYAAYERMINFTAKKVESHGAPIVRANGNVVTEPGVVESGDWCAFDINFYAFKGKSKGIAVALNAVTLLEVGERFGGGPSLDSIASEVEALYGDLTTSSNPSDDLFGSDDVFGGLSSDEDLFSGL
jgi:hypothetical protein